MVLTVVDSDEFVRLLTKCQARLYGYIFAILPDAVAAHEVLSETNVTLLKKLAEFHMGSDFAAWAFRVAYFEVLAFQKRRRSDRHVFSDELLAEMAESAAAATEHVNEKAAALDHCLEKLPQSDRPLIALRYRSGLPVQDIAKRRGKTPNAISLALLRIRAALADCVERTLGWEPTR